MGLIRSYTRFSEAELHEIYLQDSTEDVVGFVNDSAMLIRPSQWTSTRLSRPSVSCSSAPDCR